MTALTHRATHATLWSALEISARYGVQFVVMIVLARLLTPADFGLIAMLLVFTGVAALLVDGGFGTALIQRQHTTADDETTVFLSGVAIACIVAVALWFAAPLIAAFYSQPALTGLTRLLLFVLPLGALAAVPDALLTQHLDFRSRTAAEAIASLCSGVAAVLLAWRGFGVWSLAWQAIIALGARASLLWFLSGWRPRGRFRTASFHALFGFGSYMLMANLLNVITIRLQSLLIGKFFDAKTLGYYTLAQNTQLAPAQLIGNLLNRVGLPVFSTVADQPEKLANALKLSLRLAFFVFTPCMVGTAVIAKPLIIAVYGARWSPAAPLLSVLALAIAFWPLHALNLSALSARGRSDLMFRLELVKCVTSIGLIGAASLYSVMAVAFAVLASSVASVGINTWYSRRLLGYGLLAQLHDQALTLMLSALAAVAAYIPMVVLHTNTLRLLTAIATAIAVYVGVAAAFRHPAIHDTLGLIRALRPTTPTQSHDMHH